MPSESDKQPEALTVATVARVLGVCDQTVYRLIWAGKLPAFKVGRLLRVAKVDLVTFRKVHDASLDK